MLVLASNTWAVMTRAFLTGAVMSVICI